jgi:hypothetical protein
VNFIFRVRTSKDGALTTAQKILINQSGDESEKCKASNQPDLLNALFRFMRRSTTCLMFNGI